MDAVKALRLERTLESENQAVAALEVPENRVLELLLPARDPAPYPEPMTVQDWLPVAAALLAEMEEIERELNEKTDIAVPIESGVCVTATTAAAAAEEEDSPAFPRDEMRDIRDVDDLH